MLSCIKKSPPKDGRLHVFWHLRGGLGDCAAARLAVLALRAKLPASVFYYHTDSPSAAAALFVEDEKNIFLPAGQPLWYKYDVAFETCQSFKTVYVNRARVQKTAPEFLPLLDEMAKRQNEFSFFLSDNYLMEDLLGRFAVEQKLPRAALLSYLSGTDFDPLAAPSLPPQLTDGARLALRFYAPIWLLAQRWLFSGALTQENRERFRAEAGRHIAQFFGEIGGTRA